MENPESRLEEYKHITTLISKGWGEEHSIENVDNIISEYWKELSEEAKKDLFFLRDVLFLKEPELERDFPDIIEMLNSVWGTDLCEEYFDDLIFDTEGNETIFPESVFSDILFLYGVFFELKIDKNTIFKNWHISNRNSKII